MNDNFFMDNLVGSLEKDIVLERYYPLIDCKEELNIILNKAGAVRKDQISVTVIEDIRKMLGLYIQRENRPEIIPQPKEVNCHREVAIMILHTDNR